MRRLLFWFIISTLLFGLAMLSSAGVVEGQKKFGSAYYYVEHQILVGVLPGLLLLFICSRVDYRFFRKTSFFILFGALALMALVFSSNFGVTINNARSWLSIYGYTFQPAEFMKLALVVYFAAWFGSSTERIKNFGYGTMPFILIVGAVAFLLILQPDVGTLAIVMMLAAGVYILAGAPIKHILLLGLLCAAVLGILIATTPYRWNRIRTFWNPSVDPRGISYQVNQSLIGIGSGGLLGVGFGHSRQKFGFLPEPVTDSIFSIVVEELGLVGAAVTIGLFLGLFTILTRIAIRTGDRFGRIFTLGMAIWIAGQALVNIAAATGVMPMTGIPLPFISFGGTSLAALLAGLGIVLNIAKRE